MSIHVTTMTASILGLYFIYLSVLVIKARRKNQVSLGDGGVDELQKTIRAHANFSEYVPISLVLLLITEINSNGAWGLIVFAVLLLYGRIAHGAGIVKHNKPGWQRISGMLSTFTVIIGLSVWNISLLILNNLF